MDKTHTLTKTFRVSKSIRDPETKISTSIDRITLLHLKSIKVYKIQSTTKSMNTFKKKKTRLRKATVVSQRGYNLPPNLSLDFATPLPRHFPKGLNFNYLVQN